jgi:hypothetical protein
MAGDTREPAKLGNEGKHGLGKLARVCPSFRAEGKDRLPGTTIRLAKKAGNTDSS